MSLFKKILGFIFGSPAQELKDRNGMVFYVRCNKCGTPVRVRADKTHDFQRDYDTGELVLRKEMMDGGCFSLMVATIRVNGAYQIIDQAIEGGELITWEEYKQLTQTNSS